MYLREKGNRKEAKSHLYEKCFWKLKDIEVLTRHMIPERTQLKMLFFPPCEVLNAYYEEEM